ncbi:TetR/AcrR family transcriptional regulator [Woodsholea maritima]|uniref:TetR/AcrR family transcriptional regulator n=1 Tax=Woodsholea maritima TaxID=240237 RepID=UPI00039BCE6F|nr:TetR/AcrR family transcriptional regulator [Woodsholea maritima]
MATRPSKAEAILVKTEALLCDKGFNGFTIRDVADGVNVRTAAVHYHYATKTDLAIEVIKRYRQDFFTKLGPATDRDPIQRLAQVFSDMLIKEGRVCLCLRLNSEIKTLPDDIVVHIQNFNQSLADWMEEGLTRMDPHAASASRRDGALRTLALLAGAMILAQGMNDPQIFERCVTFFSMERWRQRRKNELDLISPETV